MMESPSMDKELTRNQNALSARLFRQTSQTDIGNFAIETMGLSAVLMAVAVGAEGQTLEEIENQVWPSDQVDQVSHTVREARLSRFSKLAKDTEDELSQTFKRPVEPKAVMFFSNHFTPSQSYTKKVESLFNVKLETVDFTTDVAGQIAEIVNQNTNEAMCVDVPHVKEARDALVVVSASSYQGRWLHHFEDCPSSEGMFHAGVAGDRLVQTEMMCLSADLRVGYVSQLDADILQFPYDGNRHQMFLVLPSNKDGLVDLEKNLLDGDFKLKWDLIRKRLTSSLVNVHLPRFDIESMIDMKPTLTKIGVREVFDEFNTHLSSMTTGDAYLALSAFYQAVHVSVKKEGVYSSKQSETDADSVQFLVDHPFLFFISDVHTNMIQVIGRVVEPSHASEREAIQSRETRMKLRKYLGDEDLDEDELDDGTETSASSDGEQEEEVDANDLVPSPIENDENDDYRTALDDETYVPRGHGAGLATEPSQIEDSFKPKTSRDNALMF